MSIALTSSGRHDRDDPVEDLVTNGDLRASEKVFELVHDPRSDDGGGEPWVVLMARGESSFIQASSARGTSCRRHRGAARRHRGRSDRTDLAATDQVREHQKRLFDVGGGVGPVDLVEVDVVGLQAGGAASSPPPW